MFNEYQLLPGQSALLLRHAILTMLAYWICSALLLAWMYYGEPVAFQMATYRCVMLPIFVAVAGTIAAAGLISSAKTFRMISTDEGLQVDRRAQSLTVKYSDLTKIEILPKGHLLLYTAVSAVTPAMIISNNITNRDKLDAILQQYCQYIPATRIPLLYNLYYRLTMVLLFMTTLSLHLITFNPDVRVGAGGLFLIVSAYNMIIAWQFRRSSQNYTVPILIGLLCALVIYRMFNTLINVYFMGL